MSYKELLRKYIEHIVTIESVDYINNADGVDFTDKELEILHDLAGNDYITGIIDESEIDFDNLTKDNSNIDVPSMAINQLSKMDTIDIPLTQNEHDTIKQLRRVYYNHDVKYDGNSKYTLTPKEITP